MSDYQAEYEAYMKWLAELKAGDDVFVKPHYDAAYPAKVARVTKTQIMVQNKNLVGSNYEAKFRKDGSLISSDSWHTTKLMRPTDELRELYEITALFVKARRLWENIVLPKNVEQLKEIIAVIEKYQKPKSTKDA